MIKGVKRETIPYVVEDDRGSDPKSQTIFHIMPKTGHDANLTVSRYGQASRDVRGGYKEFSVKKLDKADIEEFLSIVKKVEKFQLQDDSDYFKQFAPAGVVESSSEPEILATIASSLSPAHLTEIFDSASDPVKLEAGRHISSRKNAE